MKAKVAVVILAAGLGTRMKSDKAKVLHPIHGKPMVIYVLETARKIAGDNVILLLGNQSEKVREHVSKLGNFIYAHQEKQLGTGHAVMCALPFIPEHSEEVVILCGDVPLITPETVAGLVNDHINERRVVSILAVKFKNPTGYGRIVMDENNHVQAIVEEADATATQRRIKLINTGIFCVKREFLLYAVPKIGTDNMQGEMYITDIVKIACSENKKVGVLVGTDSLEVTGINTIQELKRVATLMKRRHLNIA
jgi:UDP-N-acetylglucosamine diphosphorylase/glucosamine-1-phosphate N-acetyltransferase